MKYLIIVFTSLILSVCGGGSSSGGGNNDEVVSRCITVTSHAYNNQARLENQLPFIQTPVILQLAWHLS